MYKVVGVLVLSFVLNASTINIAVASNVSYAIKELIKEFNKSYPDIKVRVILGSSGKLSAQIKYGAPYHIFMSANMLYPNTLYDDKLCAKKPIVYAQGKLAYLSIKTRDFSNINKLLQDKQIRKIAVANPKIAPYGKAGIDALKSMHLYESVKSKIIYAESISQTLSYTISATDIGIVALSALYTPSMSKYKEGSNWIELDNHSYKTINQGIVLLKQAKDTKGALKFYKFLLSKSAKRIFKKFGYNIL